MVSDSRSEFLRHRIRQNCNYLARPRRSSPQVKVQQSWCKIDEEWCKIDEEFSLHDLYNMIMWEFQQDFNEYLHVLTTRQQYIYSLIKASPACDVERDAHTFTNAQRFAQVTSLTKRWRHHES